MNYLDWTQLGGMPFTQNRMKFLQDANLLAFAAVAKLCGDKTILWGVDVVGSNVSTGMISVNGELVEFVGGATGPQVVIVETDQPFTYANAAVHNVQITRKASCGTTGGFPFSDLKKLDTLLLDQQKLAQLRIDFDNHQHQYTEILGRPVFYHGSQHLGDIVGDGLFVINFPNQGNASYFPAVTIISNGVPNQDNNISFSVKNKTPISFLLLVEDYASVTQDITVEYVLINNV